MGCITAIVSGLTLGVFGAAGRGVILILTWAIAFVFQVVVGLASLALLGLAAIGVGPTVASQRIRERMEEWAKTNGIPVSYHPRIESMISAASMVAVVVCILALLAVMALTITAVLTVSNVGAQAAW